MQHLIRNRRLRKGNFLVYSLLVGLASASCTYRFSNSFQRAKSSVRTLCMEAIYSTAREVVPYQHLWDAIQKRIAMDGSFFVDSCEQADAIVVGHLIEASVSPSGQIVTLDTLKIDDPEIYEPVGATPDKFRKLESGREIKRSQNVGYNLKLDVHDLRTRAIIFSKVYSRAESFQTFLGSSLVETGREFPIAEESLNSHSRSIGADFASRFVYDLRSTLLR